mmetsp:Transcript_31660/g.36136  ORF Transcript_31660/g.36136 Transcript_31660/m.36136 type:complete len:167 (-) Transcript_31660:25-525(-)
MKYLTRQINKFRKTVKIKAESIKKCKVQKLTTTLRTNTTLSVKSTNVEKTLNKHNVMKGMMKMKEITEMISNQSDSGSLESSYHDPEDCSIIVEESNESEGDNSQSERLGFTPKHVVEAEEYNMRIDGLEEQMSQLAEKIETMQQRFDSNMQVIIDMLSKKAPNGY